MHTKKKGREKQPLIFRCWLECIWRSDYCQWMHTKKKGREKQPLIFRYWLECIWRSDYCQWMHTKKKGREKQPLIFRCRLECIWRSDYCQWMHTKKSEDQTIASGCTPRRKGEKNSLWSSDIGWSVSEDQTIASGCTPRRKGEKNSLWSSDVGWSVSEDQTIASGCTPRNLKIRLLPVDAHQEERERKTASDLPILAGVYLKPVILMSYIACVRKVHAKKDFMWPADKKNSAFLRKVHPEKELDHLLEKG